ncbi:MAG: hypothetical protein Q8S73_19860 [Deltaproteobacteria bacterium]|nr:hypothetical protein [Deltaproteobacteria bacterium]
MELSLRREDFEPEARPSPEVRRDIDGSMMQQRVVRRQIRGTVENVPRITTEPGAELDASNRALLVPLKNAIENAR